MRSCGAIRSACLLSEAVDDLDDGGRRLLAILRGSAERRKQVDPKRRLRAIGAGLV